MPTSSTTPHMRTRNKRMQAFALTSTMLLALNGCGTSRLSIETMADVEEPAKVAKNIESLLRKLEHPKNNIMPDIRCAMMSTSVKLANLAKNLPLNEKDGLPFVTEEQYNRLHALLVKEIDDPGVYYKDKTLLKKGYDRSQVQNHLSSWAAYELANSNVGGDQKLQKMIGILGDSSYAGYDLAWQRAAAYNIAKQIEIVKSNKSLQLQVINSIHSSRVNARLPSNTANMYQGELEKLLSAIESHIISLPLMNASLHSLKNNSNSALIVAAIRRDYRFLDNILRSKSKDIMLQRELYENIEILRYYAFEHSDINVHTYARNTLVRFAPFTYLNGVLAQEDSAKKKIRVQETMQILPVMDAYAATLTPEDLVVYNLPSFTSAEATLEDHDNEKAAYNRAKLSSDEALKQLDAAIANDESDDETALPLAESMAGKETDTEKDLF
ncbi:MAG: hypothetical protein HRU15_12315, partial [Planctomycetes bacterium]|nr:hypothetical protein [Planctomycetota bacterium]